MDEGLSPRAHEPRRPFEMAGSTGLADVPEDGSRDGLVMQVLSTEHFSLLSQRGLAYNEAFTRAGMLLTLVSMSLVALALLSSALPEVSDLMVIAAIVLAFDLAVSVATAIRVSHAYTEDFVAVQAMNRIRHGYVELAPETVPYISTGITDDLVGVMKTYAAPIAAPSSALAGLSYWVSTSIGLVAMVTAMFAGAFVAVLGLMVGVSGGISLALGAVAVIGTLVGLMAIGRRAQARNQSQIVVRFPSPSLDGAKPATR
jgi:hypothetical protein